MDTSATTASVLRDLTEYINDEPLTALAIASAAGFVLGGGVDRRVGLAIFTMVGRIMLRSAATDLIAEALLGRNNHRKKGNRPSNEGTT